MRALVVYESIFGNTKRVAEAIAEGLRAHAEVEVREVGEALDAPHVDLLVVGGPTHAWGMSRDATREDARKQAANAHVPPVSQGIGIREWLEGLPRSAGAAAATFDTAVGIRWFPTGSAARRAAEKLRTRGFDVIAAPEQFLVDGTAGPVRDGEVERARAWGAWLVAPHGVAPARRPVERDPGAFGAAVSLALTMGMLVAAHLHHAWRPWLGGVVTAEWSDVLWAVDLSMGTQIVLGALLVLARPTWLRRLYDLASSLGALLSVSVFYAVYPFAFSRIVGGLDTAVRLGMVLVLLAILVAIAVNLVRFVVSPFAGDARVSR